MQTEAGPIAVPQLPQRWGEVETITVSYGHGLAVAPLQFAAAARRSQRRQQGLADVPEARSPSRQAKCRS